MLEGQSLLQRTLAAVHCETGLVTVVGPPDLAELLDAAAADRLVREDPPFTGPAAAVAAGLAGSPSAEWMLVLACDMPQVHQVVAALAPAVAQADSSVQALIAYDGGRQQPLAACYRRAALAHRVDELRARGELNNLSMRALIASLEEARVDVPAGSTADVDTWAQAAMWGIRAGDHRAKGHADDAGDNPGSVDG